MPEEESQPEVSGFARRLERVLGVIALTAYRRPVAAFIAIAIITGIALTLARQLRVDTDLAALLPRTFQSVRDVARLEKRFGGIGYVVVVAEQAEPQVLRRFADDIAPLIAKLPSISHVDHRRPDIFFTDRALYYLALDDLEEIKERFEERADWERRAANPLIVDLEEQAAPTLDFSDIENRYPTRRFAGSGKRETHYIDEDRRFVAIFAKPAGLATDMKYSRRVVGEVESLIAGMDLSKYPGIDVALTGRYKKRLDQKAQIERDLGASSLLALLLVVVYLLVHFRRPGALVLLITPLLIGLIWTFGLAALVFGTLNILSAFVGTILLGLGIDHGIHLLARYQRERSRGLPPEEAVSLAFTATGRAVVLAAVTTTVGFAGLSVSEFRAFREFGLIAAAGVTLGVIAYALCLPPLLALAARISPTAGPERSGVGELLARLVPRWGPALFVVTTVVGAVFISQIPNVDFEYELSALDGDGIRSFDLDRTVNEVLGRSQTPIVLLADNASQERGIGDAVRAHIAGAGDDTAIQLVVSAADLVPDEQDAKREILEEIDDVIGGIDPSAIAPADADRFARLKRMVNKQPFARADLPIGVQRHFRIADGQSGGIVLVYPGVSLTHLKAVQGFVGELRSIHTPDGKTIPAAGESMILADILTMIFRESPIAIGATLLLVFICLWVLLGRFSLAVYSYLPALFTVGVAVGLMAVTDLSLNFLNIVVIPVLFGIAVDAGIHIVLRGTGSRERLVEAIREASGGILGAVLTTGMGFGALLIAHHPGLRSLGSLALFGLAANLAATLIWLTSLLAVQYRLHARKSTAVR